LGAGALQASTLRKKILRYDMDGAAREFDRWVFAGGRKLAGLVRRRAAEREMFEG
jgi:lysozyme